MLHVARCTSPATCTLLSGACIVGFHICIILLACIALGRGAIDETSSHSVCAQLTLRVQHDIRDYVRAVANTCVIPSVDYSADVRAVVWLTSEAMRMRSVQTALSGSGSVRGIRTGEQYVQNLDLLVRTLRPQERK